MDIKEVVEFLEKKYGVDLLYLLHTADDWWSYIAEYLDTEKEAALAEDMSNAFINQINQIQEDLKNKEKQEEENAQENEEKRDK